MGVVVQALPLSICCNPVFFFWVSAFYFRLFLLSTRCPPLKSESPLLYVPPMEVSSFYNCFLYLFLSGQPPVGSSFTSPIPNKTCFFPPHYVTSELALVPFFSSYQTLSRWAKPFLFFFSSRFSDSQLRRSILWLETRMVLNWEFLIQPFLPSPGTRPEFFPGSALSSDLFFFFPFSSFSLFPHYIFSFLFSPFSSGPGERASCQ